MIWPGAARAFGGIPTNAFAFVALTAALLVLPAPVSSQLPPLVTETVHFEIPGRDLIPMVAAFRASCDILVSGEPVSLQDNGTARTTVSAAPGPCSMILILFGIDVAIPTINTTPLGESSYFIPGLSLPTLGLADVSLDLISALNSTTRVQDTTAAAVSPNEIQWTAWGAERLVAQGAHGYGDAVTSALVTPFSYALTLALTIYVAGLPVYQTGLAEFGRYVGTPLLSTPLDVDLLPHPLTLGPATRITYGGATLNWTGPVDADADHLELWLTTDHANVSYRIADPHTTALSVDLQPVTTYTARIVSVDRSGQESVSGAVTFRTLTVPSPPTPGPPTYTESQANLVVVGTFLFIALLAGLVAYGFGRVRGRT